MKIRSIIALIVVFGFSCNSLRVAESQEQGSEVQRIPATALILLGTIQDAGSPHIACQKECCKDLFTHPDKNRQVISLGLIDGENQKKYLFEATPDIARQTKKLKSYTKMIDG